MKVKRPTSARTRLMLILQLAVILPAATLVILSAWQLRHIQRDRAVEAAIQQYFGQVLGISEKRINHKERRKHREGTVFYRPVVLRSI